MGTKNSGLEFSRRGFMYGLGAGALGAVLSKHPAYAAADTQDSSALPETLSILGAEMVLHLDGKATGGRLAVLVETTPPGGGPPLHAHANEDEYFYVLDGEYEFTLDGETMRPEPGDFIIVPRGAVHRFQNVGAGPGKLHISLSPAGFEEFFRKLSTLSAAGLPDPSTMQALGAEHGLSWHQ